MSIWTSFVDAHRQGAEAAQGSLLARTPKVAISVHSGLRAEAPVASGPGWGRNGSRNYFARCQAAMPTPRLRASSPDTPRIPAYVCDQLSASWRFCVPSAKDTGSYQSGNESALCKSSSGRFAEGVSKDVAIVSGCVTVMREKGRKSLVGRTRLFLSHSGRTPIMARRAYKCAPR